MSPILAKVAVPLQVARPLYLLHVPYWPYLWPGHLALLHLLLFLLRMSENRSEPVRAPIPELQEISTASGYGWMKD